MKEGVPKQESSSDSELESKEAFFVDKFKEISGKGLVGLGSVFALAGIYEFVTGHKVGDLISAHSDNLPDMANYLINNLSNMPLIMKTAGGASMIALGGNFFKGKSSEDAAS